MLPGGRKKDAEAIDAQRNLETESACIDFDPIVLFRSRRIKLLIITHFLNRQSLTSLNELGDILETINGERLKGIAMIRGFGFVLVLFLSGCDGG